MSARPWFTATQRQRKQVVSLAECGVDHAGIAARLGVSVATVRRHFGDELAAASARAKLAIAEAMFEAATRKRSPSVAAARYFLSGALGRRRG